jgi:hypothetical protein
MTTDDPWASLVPPEVPIMEYQYHYSHGVTDVGRCAQCGDIRTLFVHSLIHTSADEANPLCATCVRSELEKAYEVANSLTSSEDMRAMRTIIRDVHRDWCENAANYQHTRAEVLAHPQGCQHCARFGTNLITAMVFDNTDVKGLVHVGCATECDNCNLYYYAPYDNDSGRWRIPLIRMAGSNGRVLHLCSACFSKEEEACDLCDSCNIWDYDSQFQYYEFIDQSVCRVCQTNISTCRSCGEDSWNDGDHSCDERHAVIKSFDFRPAGGFTFHGTDENNLFLGFELEVESCDVSDMYDSATRVNNVLSKSNRGYLKSDGSLDDGFEIVTQPHTLAAYTENFPWHIISELRDEGFRSWDTDTCGFHVHISRKAFGWRERGQVYNEGKYQAHLLRFTKLIYDNSRHVTRYVAGRSSSRWASYTDRNHLLPKVKHGHQGNSRYSAVNVANTYTIEVRVFKGSLKVERIKAYLQFVHSVAEYTRDLHVSPNENNLMWRKYTGWLRKNEQAYPELVSLITTGSSNDSEEN